jgi:hypothetical protein
VTLKDGTEVMLHPGKTVELPAGHEYTQTLLALGHLTPEKNPPPAPESGSDAPAPTKASTNTRSKKGE